MTLYSYEVPMMETSTRVSPPYDDFFESYGKFATKGIKKFEPYKGEFIAPPAKAQKEAVNLRLAQLPQYTGIGASTMQLGADMAAGRYLTENPYAARAAEAAIRPIQDKLWGDLSDITSASVQRGSYSGIRPQLAKVAANTFSRCGASCGHRLGPPTICTSAR